MQFEALTTANLIDHQTDRLASGASPATVNRELSALSACLFSAAKMTVEGGKPLLAHVPIFPTKLKESAPRSGFIETREYAALAANCSHTWLRTFIALAFAFGFRRSELLSLKVRNVDFLGGWLELEQGTTKNDESRKIKLTAETFELCKACAAGKDPSHYLLTRADGTRIVDPRRDWRTLCVACGLGKFIPAKRADGTPYKKYIGITPHDFRRSAIRQMTRRGVSETIAMKISGHKTASVFRRYNITAEADLVDATRKIELGGQTTAEKTDTKT